MLGVLPDDLAVLNRPAMPSAACQRWTHHFHGFAQFVFERKRRIDHKHPAGGQTSCGAVGVTSDGQGEVDPRFLSLIAQSAQALWQIVGFGPRNDGIPNQVSAGGKSLEAILYVSGHFPVIAFNFVTWVHEHHGALRACGRRWWWQHLLKRFETVFTGNHDAAAGVQLSHVRGKGFAVGRVQLKQTQFVARVFAQHGVKDEGRARIDLGLAIGVEAGNHVQIGLKRLGNGLGVFLGGSFIELAQEFEDPVLGFATCFGIVAIQPVKARTCMGVDDGDATFLLLQVLQGGNQGKVLDDIGMVAGVEGVSVTEHVLMLTASVRYVAKER